MSLGDAHIIPVDDVMSRDEGRDMVNVHFSTAIYSLSVSLSISPCHSLSVCLSHSQLALLVSQSRDSTGRLSGIKLSALDTGLLRVARLARRRKG